ncbi:MAG: hypothetical protein ACW99F_09970 [Candidatus Hodarchaeales archaeon]|jgi:hypothetical protein
MNKKLYLSSVLLILLILILINFIVYTSLQYLIENEDLRFGYRLESTAFVEKVGPAQIMLDESGYTIRSDHEFFNQSNAKLETIGILKRYDLAQNLQWGQMDPYDPIHMSSNEFVVWSDTSSKNQQMWISDEPNVTTLRTFKIFYPKKNESGISYDQKLDVSLSPDTPKCPDYSLERYEYSSNILNHSSSDLSHDYSKLNGIVLEDYFAFLEVTSFYCMRFDLMSGHYLWYQLQRNLTLTYFNRQTGDGKSLPLFPIENDVEILELSSLKDNMVAMKLIIKDYEGEYNNEYNSSIEIFEIDLDSTNKTILKTDEMVIPQVSCIDLSIDQFEIDCRFAINNGNFWIFKFFDGLINQKVRTELLIPSEKRLYSWNISNYDDKWHLSTFHFGENRLILGEQNEDNRTRSRLRIFSTESNDAREIELLMYDDLEKKDPHVEMSEVHIHRIFDIKDKKIAILLEGSSSNYSFYDVQVLTLDPNDLLGLMFSHELVLHLVGSGLMLLTLFILFNRIRIHSRKPNIETYPREE